MAPPSYAKAVYLHNDSPQPVTAQIVYQNHKDNSEITESSEIAAGATHLFPEKIIDMGSWQASVMQDSACARVHAPVMFDAHALSIWMLLQQSGVRHPCCTACLHCMPAQILACHVSCLFLQGAYRLHCNARGLHAAFVATPTWCCHMAHGAATCTHSAATYAHALLSHGAATCRQWRP